MPKKRTCIRCGCTDDKACPGGCEWVGGIAVCTACLTAEESELFTSLQINGDDALQAVSLAKYNLVESRKQKNELERLILERSEMVKCIKLLRGVVLEVTPQMGKIVLQDYKRLNLGLMLANKLVGEV